MLSGNKETCEISWKFLITGQTTDPSAKLGVTAGYLLPAIILN